MPECHDDVCITCSDTAVTVTVVRLLDDGLAYVKEESDVKSDPGGSAGMAAAPEDLEDAVVEASEECPGECIFIEQG